MKRALQEDRAIIAITTNFANAGLTEYLGRLGYDAVVMDGEHGGFSSTEVEEFARACDVTGVCSLLRLPLNTELIRRYLDIGVHGFHIPHIESVAQARQAVDAMKFRPLGTRGVGTFRATDYGQSLGSWADYPARANAETFVKVAIEDAEGLAAVPEIAKLEGIDVIAFGTGDLAASMGFSGSRNHPKVNEVVDKAIAIVRAAGKAAGLPTHTTEEIKDAYKRGARFMSTGIARVISLGASSYLQTMKELA